MSVTIDPGGVIMRVQVCGTLAANRCYGVIVVQCAPSGDLATVQCNGQVVGSGAQKTVIVCYIQVVHKGIWAALEAGF